MFESQVPCEECGIIVQLFDAFDTAICEECANDLYEEQQ